MPGTDRSTWRRPSPTLRLASRISSPEWPPLWSCPTAGTEWSIGAQQVIANGDAGLAERLVGVPGRVAEQREHDDQSEHAGDEAEQDHDEHDRSPDQQYRQIVPDQ